MGDNGRVYVNAEYYMVAAAYWQPLGPDQAARDVVQEFVDSAAQVPQLGVLAWNLSEDAGVALATFHTSVGPVNQNAIQPFVARGTTRNAWFNNAPNQDAVAVLVELISQ